MKKQNKNFLMNVGYQLLMYLFPLVTAVYISRTLGAEQLGVYAYVNSIVTILGMFGILGISNYGNREVAKNRDDRVKLSEVFSSIYCLQFVMSIIVLIIYITILIFIPVQYKTIFFIQMLHILAVAFDVTWLFFGLEKFKVTLTRNFIVKIVSFLLIMLCVKTPNDIEIYTLIMCGASIISQLCLLYLAKKEVIFKIVGINKIIPHIKSCIILFIPVLAFSIYRIMDKTMLGAMCVKSQLGFYENAERIINIPIMVISALGTVMMPHMSYILEKKGEEYKKTMQFSMRLALSIATYSTMGLLVIGEDLAVVLFGQAYQPSGKLIMILGFTIIASAWSNVIRTQYLIPNRMDRPYVVSTITGAIVNLICNMIFIPKLQAVGACIGTLAAEFAIVVIQTIYVKALEIYVYVKIFIVQFIKATVSMLIVAWVGHMISSIYLSCFLEVGLAMMLYLIFNRNLVFEEFLGIKSKR